MITRFSELRRRARFAAWAAGVRLQLRRRGMRLRVEAPHPVRMDGRPHLGFLPGGAPGGSLTLRLGRGASLGRALHLDVQPGGDNLLTFGDGAYVMHGVRVQLRGGAIELGPHANVRDGAVLKSEGRLRVGRDVVVSYGTIIHCLQEVVLEDHAGLAERVTVADSDHSHDGTAAPFLRQPLRVEPVRIGRNVFVAANAVVLRGARIGPNAVVAAGAVVPGGEHEGGWLYAGAPLRPVRRLGAP